MKQDYLSQVLPPERPAVTAAELPDAAAMREAAREADAIHETLDMIRFTEEERDQVGPASTPEELELNRLYAEAADQLPFLMTLIGRPAGALRHGYDLERALHVYREANLGLVRAARAALILTGAALTRDNDRAEDAAAALARDPRLPPERRAIIDNARRSLDSLRRRVQGATEQRRARRERRAARHEAELRLSQHRAEEARQIAQLTSAPLPDSGAPSERR